MIRTKRHPPLDTKGALNVDTMPPAELLELVDDSPVELVTNMMGIPGKSGHEAAIAEFIVSQLKAAGVPDSAISFDTAHKKSHIGGEVGNLIVKLPGTIRGPRRLLMAHMDTVPLCVGSQPVRKGDFISSKDPTTALGGDDRAGSAVVLNAALTLLKHDIPRPPLTLFWAVQEEIGLVGAKNLTVSKLGKPSLCFNWDGGAPELAVIGATSDDHMDIRVHGIASHAGAHPADGVSAITIASKAIADLSDNGWLGLVEKGRRRGTSNVGFIEGGEATNVVTDLVTLRAEARSHDAAFRLRIVEEFRKAFNRAARKLKNAGKQKGSVEFETRNKYEAFALSPEEPIVQEACQAIEAAGLTAGTRIVDGGLDANWMTAHGFPTVTLGCGQMGIHTVEEKLSIPDFLHACRIALLLATGILTR